MASDAAASTQRALVPMVELVPLTVISSSSRAAEFPRMERVGTRPPAATSLAVDLHTGPAGRD